MIKKITLGRLIGRLNLKMFPNIFFLKIFPFSALSIILYDANVSISLLRCFLMESTEDKRRLSRTSGW